MAIAGLPKWSDVTTPEELLVPKVRPPLDPVWGSSAIYLVGPDEYEDGTGINNVRWWALYYRHESIQTVFYLVRAADDGVSWERPRIMSRNSWVLPNLVELHAAFDAEGKVTVACREEPEHDMLTLFYPELDTYSGLTSEVTKWRYRLIYGHRTPVLILDKPRRNLWVTEQRPELHLFYVGHDDYIYSRVDSSKFVTPTFGDPHPFANGHPWEMKCNRVKKGVLLTGGGYRIDGKFQLEWKIRKDDQSPELELYTREFMRSSRYPYTHSPVSTASGAGVVPLSLAVITEPDLGLVSEAVTVPSIGVSIQLDATVMGYDTPFEGHFGMPGMIIESMTFVDAVETPVPNPMDSFTTSAGMSITLRDTANRVAGTDINTTPVVIPVSLSVTTA